MSGFQEKHFKIREAIRSKQIQQYKQKIRIKHAQENANINSNFDQTNHFSVNCQSKTRLIQNLVQNIDQHKAYLSEVADSLHKLQENYSDLDSSKIENFTSPSKGQNEELAHLKELICEKYEIFLNFWIQIEEIVQKTGELNQKHLEIYLHIFKIVSELSKTGIWVWKDYQRSCFSYYFGFFLFQLQSSKTRTLLSFQQYIRSIEISANYILNLLAKSKDNKKKQPNASHLFEFTQLDQLIIMHIFDHIFQIKEDVDYYMEIKFYVERKLTDESFFEKQNSLGYKLKGLILKLTQIQHEYLHEYLEEQSIRQQQEIQECPEIGNITNGTVKSTLRFAMSTFFTQLLSIADGIDKMQNVSLRKVQDLYEQIFEEANQIIQLLTQFCRTLDCTTNDFFGEFEDSTSSDITETILGMMFALCQGAINSVGKVQQIEENSQLNCQNKRYASESIFSIINHKDIVSCLTFFLSRRMYSQQFIHDLFNQSNISIYILTCIFNQQTQKVNDSQNNTQNNRQLESYSQAECKRNQSLISNKNSALQMQCLKAIEAFLKNYGIKVDEEDNLLLRYIKNSGDNNSNFYYEKLAGTRGRMKI